MSAVVYQLSIAQLVLRNGCNKEHMIRNPARRMTSGALLIRHLKRNQAGWGAGMC